jgi:hypothetical protein
MPSGSRCTALSQKAVQCLLAGSIPPAAALSAATETVILSALQLLLQTSKRYFWTPYSQPVVCKPVLGFQEKSMHP